LLAVDCDYRDHFLQSCTTVAAACPIDLDHAFVQIVGQFGSADAHGATSNLQNVARSRSYPLHVGGRESSNGMAYVFDARLGNPEGDRCSVRRRCARFRHDVN
jgi:hypothetical protein